MQTSASFREIFTSRISFHKKTYSLEAHGDVGVETPVLHTATVCGIGAITQGQWRVDF